MLSKYPLLSQLPIWLLVRAVSAGSIAAWWNTRGPNIMMQDDQTGDIRYSLCNGNSTPIFPTDGNYVAPLQKPYPKKNTGLSVAGWADGVTTFASIFYMDNTDSIVNSLLKCDWNSGRWTNVGDYVISSGLPKPANDSAITALLLGATEGYRVFYNDAEGALQSIGYTSDKELWSYYGVVSEDQRTGRAIGAAFSSGDQNMTVIRPRDGKNIGVSRWHDDGLWHLTSFPQPLSGTGPNYTNATSREDLTLSSGTPQFNLTAWDGNASSIGVVIDSSYTRSIFYIGTDSKLYQASNSDGTWSLVNPPNDAAWPHADNPSGAVGVASDFDSNTMRIYYVSEGHIVEANGDNGKWQNAIAVPSFNQSQVATDDLPPVLTTKPADEEGGLSNAAKTGLSAGITLGAIAIGGLVAVLFFLRRKQRKRDAEAAKLAAISRDSLERAGGDQGAEPYVIPGNIAQTYPSEYNSSDYATNMTSAGTASYVDTRGNSQAMYDQTVYSPMSDRPYGQDQSSYQQAAVYTADPNGLSPHEYMQHAYIQQPQQVHHQPSQDWSAIYAAQSAHEQQPQQYYQQYQHYPQQEQSPPPQEQYQEPSYRQQQEQMHQEQQQSYQQPSYQQQQQQRQDPQRIPPAYISHSPEERSPRHLPAEMLGEGHYKEMEG